MSITRAFTTRRVKQSMHVEAESGPQPARSNTTRSAIGSIRYKISAPVELIHSTNVLSYNAPDIYPKAADSTNSSHRSDDDLSDSAPTRASTPPTSPDIESPRRPLSPQPNHLSCYFTVPGQSAAPKVDAPVIPQRAASHTKKSYDSLVRQRSISRMSEQSQRSVSTKSSFTFSRSSSASTSTTATSQSSTSLHKSKASGSFAASPQAFQSQFNHRKEFSVAQHPFGNELAQVSEIAEEYGVKEQLNDIETEEQELAAKGLQKFSAEDYLGEIQGLFANLFGESKAMATAMWI